MVLIIISHLFMTTFNIFSFAATGNQISSLPYNAKDELNQRVDLIRRNVKNLLKIAKRDSWVCDRFPYTHGRNMIFSTIFVSKTKIKSIELTHTIFQPLKVTSK